MSDFIKDLDTPLLQLTAHSTLDLRTVLGGGCHIFGSTGAGKSTAAKTLAASLLRAGCGMLVMCTKSEEIEVWRAYAKANGRSSSVILFDETKSFAFIDWLLAKYGVRGLGTITDALLRIVESVDLAAGGLGGVSQESFWQEASRALLSYSVTVLHGANGRVSVPDIVAFVNSAATNARQYVDDPDFAASSFAAQTLRKAVDNPAVRLGKEFLGPALEYWFRGFTAMSDKTRANVLVSLTAKLDRFVQPGLLRDVFCSGRTDIVPEMTFGGSIIIMALPVLTLAEDGIIAQHLFKYAWMRAVESRNALEQTQRERPVVLWADESHNFLSLRDSQFISMSRGSRASVVMLTQNLPSYYAKLGENRIQTVNGLIGQFNTHIFHLNSCTVTNEWASKLVGKGIHRRANASSSKGSNRSANMNDGRATNTGSSDGSSTSFGGQGGGGSNWNSSTNSGASENNGESVGRGTNEGRTEGYSEQMDFIIEPADFSVGLRTGGPAANNYRVDAFWFKAGGSFNDGLTRNVLKVTFRQ